MSTTEASLNAREPQLRGAKVQGDRPVNQNEAADRFIAATEHERMHDERLWAQRQKRDRVAHSIEEWEELRELASRIKQHTLTHLDQYLDEFEAVQRELLAVIGAPTKSFART